MSQPRSGPVPAESTQAPSRLDPPAAGRGGGAGAVAIAGEPLATDICVIGAGSGGLAVAAMAVAFGRKVVMVEKHRSGGGGPGMGTVASKALLASARRAQALRTAAEFGIGAVEPQIDPRAVQQHIRSVAAAVAPNSSIERIAGLGVNVIQGAARFLDKRTVLAGDYRITARRFVIATGSSPAVPDVPGIEACPYYTSDSIFEADRKISHLIVAGGGPSGLELAQAYLRLGSRVTVIEADRPLREEDPEAAAVVLGALRAEGIDIREGARVERVESMAGFVRVHVATDRGVEAVDGSHLVFATGRRANISDLNLEAAGIDYGPEGIKVNRGLRTTNGRVYAIGDVTGDARSAHASGYHAEIVLRRALFWLPAKVDPAIIPRVAFTDPELAHVGLTEDQARAAGHKINVLRWPFVENDRAQAERETRGHVKIVTTAKGRVLGATIAGAGAGEQIHVWALAVSQRLPIKAMTAMVAPYPTFGEAGRRAALRYYTTTPAKRTIRKLIDLLARLG